jgi:hypothetical protein
MEEALSFLAERDIIPHWGPVDLGGTKRAEITDPGGTILIFARKV